MKLNLTKEKVLTVVISGVVFGLIGFYLGKYMARKDMMANFQNRRSQNGGNWQGDQNNQPSSGNNQRQRNNIDR